MCDHQDHDELPESGGTWHDQLRELYDQPLPEDVAMVACIVHAQRTRDTDALGRLALELVFGLDERRERPLVQAAVHRLRRLLRARRVTPESLFLLTCLLAACDGLLALAQENHCGTEALSRYLQLVGHRRKAAKS